MSSWKTLGGMDKFDKTNNITVNSLVANYFVIKKSIVGDIDISGNISIGKNLFVDKDASFNGNISVNGSMNTATFTADDITCNGNGYFKNNVNVSSVLYFGNASNLIYLYGDASGIGLNHKSPQASFDISGNMTASINVFSSQNTNRNILSQNVNQKGIVLWTDTSNSTIDFFNDSIISSSEGGFDGRIQYQNGGNLLIDASSVVKILPKLVVSDLSSDTGIKNSTVSIHNDISDNIYLYDIYNNDRACLQNGISMVGMDNSAIMFMNMITPDNTGFSIGGGTYPYDNSRNMGTFGIIDVSNVLFVPSQTIVSGNSAVKYKTTTGINTYKPRTESYVLDVNGPLHVTNGESSVVEKPLWEVSDMKFCNNNANIGIAIGYPSTFTSSDFDLECYYTTDKGVSWNSSNIATNKISGGVQKMRAVYVHDASYAFIYGDKMIGYYTFTGGIDWSKNSISDASEDAKSLYIYTDGSNSRFFIGTNASTMYYYDASIGYINSGGNYYTDTSAVILSYPTMDVSGSYVHGVNGNIYVAGNGIVKYSASSLSELSRHDNDMSYNSIFAYDSSFVVAVGDAILSYTHNGGTDWTDISQNTQDLTIQNTNLTSVHAYDASNAIAVGDDGAMVYTNDGYVWRTASHNMLNSAGTGNLLDGSLNHVCIFDKNEFILSNVKSSYSTTTDTTTGVTSYNVGYTNLVYNFLPDLLNHLENHVMDVCGNMTIYGNIYMDSDASGANEIQSTRNSVYFMNNTVENLYIGADASNIQIGKNDNGKTIVRHAMDISGNVDIRGNSIQIGKSDSGKTQFRHPVDISGNVVINGYITSLGTTSTVTSVYSMIIDWDKRTDTDVVYALDVSGTNANAKIDGSLNVIGDVYISSNSSALGDASGALYITGGTKMNGQVVIANTTGASSDSSGALYVSGGGYFNGNLVAGSNHTSGGFQVYGGSDFSGNVVISSTQDATGDSANAALYVSGGAKILGNVIADKNLYITGTNTGSTYSYPLYVASGTSRFEKNLEIGGNLTVSGNVSFQGSVNNNGNTWTTSDYRIKDGVVSLVDLSYGVDNLRPVYYYNTIAQHPQIGFLAHELQEDFSFLVNGEKDGENYQSVNYNGLIGLLVYEIQELKKQVALLKR